MTKRNITMESGAANAALHWEEDGVPHRLDVEVRLMTVPGEHQTTHHAKITDPYRVAVTGTIKSKRPSGYWQDEGGGQVGDYVDWESAKPGRRFPADIAELIKTVWGWHLNDVKAACAHQTVVWEQGPYGRQPSLELTEPCEESGYRYGSAWLVEPLSEDQLATIRRLIEVLRKNGTGVGPNHPVIRVHA